MSESAQKRLVSILAMGISYGMSHAIVSRLIDIPEQRGVKDDVLEAAARAVTTLASTVVASFVVRELVQRLLED